MKKLEGLTLINTFYVKHKLWAVSYSLSRQVCGNKPVPRLAGLEVVLISKKTKR